MSRSGYSDDCWGAELNLYRGRVARSLQGKRGQAALRDLAAALDAMPIKELHGGSFQKEGTCALGALAERRGLDVSDLEPWYNADIGEMDVDQQAVGERFGIAACMAAEIMYENDERGLTYQWHEDPGKRYREETPAERWKRMRAWVQEQLKDEE